MSESAQIPPAAPPALSDAIERLLANPELLSSVASAIGFSPPVKSEIADAPTPEPSLPNASSPPSDLGNTVATLAPLLSGMMGKGDGGRLAPDDPRTCLLRALKPYVNPRRAEAIDTVIQLSRMTEIVKKLNEKGG